MVEEAISINRKIGNMHLPDTIVKEEENLKVAFHISPNGEKAPNGCQVVNSYMVFDIKIENLRRKAYLVVGSHTTQMLDIITYLSMVIREIYAISLP